MQSGALGCLRGRFSGCVLGSGEYLVPEEALQSAGGSERPLYRHGQDESVRGSFKKSESHMEVKEIAMRTSFGESIIQGLTELAEALENDEEVATHFTLQACCLRPRANALKSRIGPRNARNPAEPVREYSRNSWAFPSAPFRRT